MPTRRSYLDIVQDAKTRIQNNTPVNNFNAQGITKAFVDVLGLEIEKYYNDLEYVYNAIDPTMAVGNDLDKIATMLGENRLNGSTASDYTKTNFYFYLDQRLNMSLSSLIKRNYSYEERETLIANGFLTKDTNNEPTKVIVPNGTVIQSSDGSISYVTIEDAEITDAEFYVGIVAVGSGPAYNVGTNVLVGHTIQEIPELRKISAYIKCSNRFPIQNGSYSMTDEELRYKISTSRAALQSNELSIRRAILSIPGIRDVLFEKNKFGNGTVSVIIDGVSPLTSQGLLDTAKELVQQKMSYGDCIYVSRPNYLGVELSFGIVVSPTETNELLLRQQAASSVIQYINDLPIGGEIVWNQIINRVMDISGIEDFIPKVFKLGEYDIINKINKNQTLLRFDNQKSKYNEKFYCDTGLALCCVA
jgi:uncharacterized phage protein gp47/JayE